MRYIVVILSTFGFISIYSTIMEIMRVNAEGYGMYSSAEIVGATLATFIISIPIILILYYFMTRTKANEVLEKKYPISFIFIVLIILLIIERLKILGLQSI